MERKKLLVHQHRQWKSQKWSLGGAHIEEIFWGGGVRSGEIVVFNPMESLLFICTWGERIYPTIWFYFSRAGARGPGGVEHRGSYQLEYKRIPSYYIIRTLDLPLLLLLTNFHDWNRHTSCKPMQNQLLLCLLNADTQCWKMFTHPVNGSLIIYRALTFSSIPTYKWVLGPSPGPKLAPPVSIEEVIN